MAVLRAVNLVQKLLKHCSLEVVSWLFRRQNAMKRRFFRFAVANDQLAREKVHHRHPGDRFLLCRHRTDRTPSRHFCVAAGQTRYFDVVFLRQTRQNRADSRFSKICGRRWQDNAETNAPRSCRGSLPNRSATEKRKKLPDPEKGMDSLKKCLRTSKAHSRLKLELTGTRS